MHNEEQLRNLAYKFTLKIVNPTRSRLQIIPCKGLIVDNDKLCCEVEVPDKIFEISSVEDLTYRIEELESQLAYECECNKQFVECQNELEITKKALTLACEDVYNSGCNWVQDFYKNDNDVMQTYINIAKEMMKSE